MKRVRIELSLVGGLEAAPQRRLAELFLSREVCSHMAM